MEQLIVIPTHRSGVPFLNSLLLSLKDTDSYPILIVINDWQPQDDEAFLKVVNEYPQLQISIERLRSNSFELGGLHAALSKTQSEEFLLLPHACRIVNPSIVDVVFHEFNGQSVAFSAMFANWRGALGESREFEPIILKYLDPKTHERLLNLGKFIFIPSLVGKYRREILEQMDFQSYVPTNILEAFANGEYLFSNDYIALDKEMIVLFPDWIDQPKFEHIYGKTRMKLENEFIIKWKSHWTPQMIFDGLPHD